MPALKYRARIPHYADPAISERILEDIRLGMSVRAIAGDLGIHKDTFHGWLRDGRAQLLELDTRPPEPGSLADFAARCERAYHDFERENIYHVRGARSPDAKGWIPAMALLRSRNPEEWVEKHDREASINIGTVNIVSISTDTLDAAQSVLQALARRGLPALAPPTEGDAATTEEADFTEVTDA